MTGRTIIIISILFAVLIVVNTFIFAYREQTDNLIDLYIAKITTCGNIADEQVCFDKSFCKGIYGPSCQNCTDSVFLECKKITSRDKVINANQKSLCSSTNGQWQVGMRGEQCSCPIGMKFNQLSGCAPR